MIVRHPALLHSNMETTIKPKVSALFTALNSKHSALSAGDNEIVVERRQCFGLECSKIDG